MDKIEQKKWWCVTTGDVWWIQHGDKALAGNEVSGLLNALEAENADLRARLDAAIEASGIAESGRLKAEGRVGLASGEYIDASHRREAMTH